MFLTYHTCRHVLSALASLVWLLGCVTCQAQTTDPLDLRFKSIASIAVDIRANAEKLPEDLARQVFDEAATPTHNLVHARDWAATGYTWTAPAVTYKPLYFEHVGLERNGRHYGVLQPAVSAAHFFGRLPAVPYIHGAQLGHHHLRADGRERSAAHRHLRGALYQGAATAGAIFFVP